MKLRKLFREELGAKQFEEEISVPKLRKLKRKQNPDYEPRSVETKKSRPKEKLVKHAPEEISSKRRPPKMRQARGRNSLKNSYSSEMIPRPQTSGKVLILEYSCPDKDRKSHRSTISRRCNPI